MNSNSQQLNEGKESNNLLISTPLRKMGNQTTPNIDMLNNSSINTPKGTKIYHPFLSSIINNLDKPFTSPDMFNKTHEYPHRDSSLLSPDLIGNLFPKEINTNVEIQHQFEDSLFMKYQSFFDKKTAQFFTENIIKASPKPHDSGIGLSLQSTELSSMDIERSFIAPISLFSHETPPSKFKWNQAEYRNKKCCSSLLRGVSFEDIDDQLNPIIDQENLESTQLDINKSCLADNLSMRQQSAIGSPMFYEDRLTSSLNESVSLKNFLRSSPHAKCNPLAMNDINLSPIKHGSDDDMETDEEFS